MERKNLEQKIQPLERSLSIDTIKRILETNSDINIGVEVVEEVKYLIPKLPFNKEDDIFANYIESNEKKMMYKIILRNDLCLAPRNPKNDHTKYDVNLKDLKLRHHSEHYYYATGGGPEREVKLPILHKLVDVLKDYNFLAREASINSNSGAIKHILFNRLMLADLIQFNLLAEYNVNEYNVKERKRELEYVAKIEKMHLSYKFLKELSSHKEEKRVNANLIKYKLVEMNRIIIFPNKKLVKMYKKLLNKKFKGESTRNFSLEENVDYGTEQSIFTFNSRPYSSKIEEQNRVFIYLPVVLIEQGQLKLDDLNEKAWGLRNIVNEYKKNLDFK